MALMSAALIVDLYVVDAADHLPWFRGTSVVLDPQAARPRPLDARRLGSFGIDVEHHGPIVVAVPAEDLYPVYSVDCSTTGLESAHHFRTNAPPARASTTVSPKRRRMSVVL